MIYKNYSIVFRHKKINFLHIPGYNERDLTQLFMRCFCISKQFKHFEISKKISSHFEEANNAKLSNNFVIFRLFL